MSWQNHPAFSGQAAPTQETIVEDKQIPENIQKLCDKIKHYAKQNPDNYRAQQAATMADDCLRAAADGQWKEWGQSNAKTLAGYLRPLGSGEKAPPAVTRDVMLTGEALGGAVKEVFGEMEDRSVWLYPKL